MVYQWKTNYYKVDADVAGKVFEELESTVGLTAKSVVEASRDKTAPLHDEFEWDDEVAGEFWREHQARRMICNLTITVETEDKQELPIRAYVAIASKEESDKERPLRYENISTVLRSEEKTNSLMDMAMKELMSFKKKYATIEALAGVFREIDKLKHN